MMHPDDIDHDDARRCLDCEALLFGAAAIATGRCDECHFGLTTPTEAPPVAAPLNPDCAMNKHQACSGTAWDDATDSLTACWCHCHGVTGGA
jgi:hypothetical protein